MLLNPQQGQLLQPTRLYDRTGQQLLLTLENPGIPRRYLAVDPDQAEHFSPQLVQVTLALLEPKYWQDSGVAWDRLTAPQPATIAERLVADLLLEKENPGLRRALRMRLLSAQLVARYGRSRVLEWYLNSAPMGHLAYGMDAAAQLYLGKPASQVNLSESVLLAVVLQAPVLNPLEAPQAARERHAAALEDLFSRGVIGAPEYQQARDEALAFRAAPDESAQPYRAFTRLVVDQLAARFGRSRLERGGLRVITSLDVDLQQQAACAVQVQLARLEGRVDPPAAQNCPAGQLLPTLAPGAAAAQRGLQASLVVLDPQSGEVLALLGDTGTQGEAERLGTHQPGSLLTPFVALAGFARGMGPASLVWDIPATLPTSLRDSANPDGRFHGPQRLRLALANDYLAPFSGLLASVGAQNVWRLAEPMGLTRLASSEDPAGLLYGGGQASLLELAQAYSTFANLGTQNGQPVSGGGRLQPAAMLLVEDLAGRTLLDAHQPQSQAVVSPQLAYLVHHILSDETARWASLGYPNPLEIGRPAGGKVGQTAGGRETWAVGYTRQRLTLVWLSLPEDAPAGAGLSVRPAAGIWHALMQYASRGLPDVNWSAPAGITTLDVCDPSGELPTAYCPTVVSEVFINGSEPATADTLYRIFQVNRETNRLATVFTPLTLVEQRTYLVAPPEAADWARQNGLEQPPSEYDDIQAPPASANAQITRPALFAYVRGQVALRGSAAGDGFVSYSVQVGEGLNPLNWLQVGRESTTPVRDGTLVTWDTAGLNGLYAVRLVVVRSGQQVESAVIQVTVDNTAPRVSAAFPTPGQVIAYPSGGVTLQASASDAVGLSRVEWYIDGVKVAEAAQSPFTAVWQPVQGSHRLVVRAVDLAGNTAETAPVEFRVGR